MTTRRPSKHTEKPNIGNDIVRGLEGLRNALADGTPLSKRFTMRTIELRLEPRQWSPGDIVRLRKRLSASQSVFAMVLGTSVKTVQAWEHGSPPPPMARRLLECIDSSAEQWENVLKTAASTRAAS
jgi:putative transcriptional regulator